MPDEKKNNITLVLLILLALSFILVVVNYYNAGKARNACKKEKEAHLWEEERANQLSLERQAIIQNRDALTEKIKSLEAALEQERLAFQKAQQDLKNLEINNKGLEEKLEKAARLEEILEKELKETLLQREKEKEKAIKKKK